MDSYKYFLPLGSVVKVKNKKTPVMIIQEHVSPELDYLGIDHPFGFSEERAIHKFNIDDVEEIYFLGFQNKATHEQIVRNNIAKIREGAKKNDR